MQDRSQGNVVHEVAAGAQARTRYSHRRRDADMHMPGQRAARRGERESVCVCGQLPIVSRVMTLDTRCSL